MKYLMNINQKNTILLYFKIANSNLSTNYDINVRLAYANDQ